MDIVCATDGNYLPHCVAMLQSLWDNNKDENLRVYLIYDNADSTVLGLAMEHLSAILPSISFLKASATPLRGFPVSGHATIATYFRLLLVELLPDSINRVVFIDADCTVTAPLQELWRMPLHGKALAAVPEHLMSCLDHGYVHGEYFNAGVMLVDLVKWRQSDLIQRGRLFASAHPDQLRHWDQDVLNHIFQNDWLPISDRWNACPHLFGLNHSYDLSPENLNVNERDAIKSPAIVHFAGPGPVKPWNAQCLHPFRNSYLDAKAKTPWSSNPLDDIPPSRLKRAYQDNVFRLKCQMRKLLPRSTDNV